MIDWSRRRVLGSLGAIAAPASLGFAGELLRRSLPEAPWERIETMKPGPCTPARLAGLPDPARKRLVFKSFRTIVAEQVTDCHGVVHDVPDYTPD